MISANTLAWAMRLHNDLFATTESAAGRYSLFLKCRVHISHLADRGAAAEALTRAFENHSELRHEFSLEMHDDTLIRLD